MKLLKLGDRITISKRLYRRSKEVKGINDVGKYIQPHEERYWVSDRLKEPIEVMIIGKRTLKNGNVIYEGEIGNVFYQTGFVQAYLVVKDMNSKPFYIEIERSW